MSATLGAPIGVIADTHGLLRDEALILLSGCCRILHLGDVGHRDEDARILEMLETLAPVTRVRGNIDTASWAETMPYHETIVVDGWTLYLVHRLEDADPPSDAQAILHGHSHKPRNEWRDGRLLFNPGAAGKRRFKLPITLGKLWFTPDGLKSAIVHLPL